MGQNKVCSLQSGTVNKFYRCVGSGARLSEFEPHTCYFLRQFLHLKNGGNNSDNHKGVF